MNLLITYDMLSLTQYLWTEFILHSFIEVYERDQCL